MPMTTHHAGQLAVSTTVLVRLELTTEYSQGVHVQYVYYASIDAKDTTSRYIFVSSSIYLLLFRRELK